MNLFQKKHKRDLRQKQPPKRKGVKLENKKRQLADFLGKQSEKLSPGGKKILLLVFGIVMGGMSLSLVIEPFRESKASASFPMPERIGPSVIAIPRSIGEPLLLREEYELLTGFLQTLDSLRLRDPVTYGEVMKGREGLVDSIKFLISTY